MIEKIPHAIQQFYFICIEAVVGEPSVAGVVLGKQAHDQFVRSYKTKKGHFFLFEIKTNESSYISTKINLEEAVQVNCHQLFMDEKGPEAAPGLRVKLIKNVTAPPGPQGASRGCANWGSRGSLVLSPMMCLKEEVDEDQGCFSPHAN